MNSKQTYNVYDASGELIMTAPMRTIAATFGIRTVGVQHIMHDLDGGAIYSEFHFNGRSVLFGLDKIKIAKAT